MRKVKSDSKPHGLNVELSYEIKIALHQSAVHEYSVISRCRIIWLIRFIMRTEVSLLHPNCKTRKKKCGMSGLTYNASLWSFFLRTHDGDVQWFQTK